MCAGTHGQKVYTVPPGVRPIAIIDEINDTAGAVSWGVGMKPIGRLQLVLAAASLSSVLMGSNIWAQSAKSADSHELTQTGRGVWIQRGRKQQKIGKVVAHESADGLRAEFLLENGSREHLAGTIVGRDESSLKINLAGSGEAKAEGYLQVEAAPNHGIRSAYAAGKVNGQAFFVQFTDKKPLRVNSLADGTGTWSMKSAPPTVISAVGFLLDTRMRPDVGVFLSDGKLRRFSGTVRSKDEKTGTYLIALKHSGTADASGQMKVRLSAKNNIIHADGDITLDGQPVRVQFDPRIDPKIRASILETDAARMRTVEGQRTMGDAGTKYTAHADESGVRYIEAEFNQGDDGSSHRKMYFEKGKLFYYGEQGQLRNTAAKSSGQMNLVEFALSFSPEGKLQSSLKSVNGKAVKLGPHDATGAVAYAEALRKAAEEKLGK